MVMRSFGTEINNCTGSSMSSFEGKPSIQIPFEWLYFEIDDFSSMYRPFRKLLISRVDLTSLPERVPGIQRSPPFGILE
jgi:hypothetical protein